MYNFSPVYCVDPTKSPDTDFPPFVAMVLPETSVAFVVPLPYLNRDHFLLTFTTLYNLSKVASLQCKDTVRCFT